MDKVFIEQLEVITTIGVYDWEQEIKQKLVLDIEMAHDNRLRVKVMMCKMLWIMPRSVQRC